MKKIKMLVLSLTGDCNFSCVYCYAAQHDRRAMCLETAFKAVDLAAASGEKFVLQFSGGEPLLNFAVLKEVVLYVEKNNILAVLQMQTNASLLTKEIAAFLVEHKVGIGISLDGGPRVNDQLRLLKSGRGATAEIVKGITLLRKMGIAVGVTCVVTKMNVDDLPEIINMVYYLGNVRKIGFDLLRGQGRGANLQAPDWAAVERAMQKTYETAAQFTSLTGVRLQFAQVERVQNLKKGSSADFGHCYAMNGEAVFVDAAGELYACSSLIGNPDFHIGNVQTGIETEKQAKIAKGIKANMMFCRECRDFQLCGGGCFARWYGSGQKTAYEAECALKRVSIAWA